MAWVRMSGGGTSFPSPFSFYGLEGTYNVPTNGNYVLTSTNISPAIVPGCTLNFKMHNDSTSVCYYYVEAKTEDSSTWTRIFTSGVNATADVEYDINLNSFVGSKIQIRVGTKSNQPYTTLPWTWKGATIIKE